jgi:hypothetical protein
MVYEISLLLLLVFVLLVAQQFPRRFLTENFANQLSGQTEYPQCSYQTASEYNVKKRELDVLLQKMESMRMDITQGRGRIYYSIDIPYSAEQDIEPAAVLIGRCQKRLLRQRDIELATDRYQTRGNQLIDGLDAYFPNASATARDNLKSRVTSLKSLMLGQCMTEQPQLDMPDGVRDPAFYEPPVLEQLRATSTFMNVQ